MCSLSIKTSERSLQQTFNPKHSLFKKRPKRENCTDTGVWDNNNVNVEGILFEKSGTQNDMETAGLQCKYKNESNVLFFQKI